MDLPLSQLGILLKLRLYSVLKILTIEPLTGPTPENQSVKILD